MLGARPLALAIAALLAVACKDPPARKGEPAGSHVTVAGCEVALRPTGDVVVDTWAPPPEPAPAPAKQPVPTGPPAPKVTFERPDVTGAMSRDLVLRTVKKQRKRFEACYAAVIRRKPAVAGTLTAQFTIGPASTVVAGRADGLDDELGRCVMQVLRELQFPHARGGGQTAVRLPISFRMEVSAELRDAPMPETPDAGVSAPPSPLAALTWADEGADPALDRWVADTAAAAVRAAAADCPLDDHTGSLRVRLGFGEAGAVVASEAWGLGAAAAEDCLRDRLVRLSLAAPPSPVAVTCDLIAGAARPWKVTVRPEHHVVDVDAVTDPATVRGDPEVVHVVRATGRTSAPALARVLDALERPRVPYRIAIDDVLISDLVPRGAGPASAAAWPRIRLEVTRAAPPTADQVRALVTCTDCQRIIELAPGDDVDAARIRQAAEHVHAAGLDRIVIVP